MNRLQMTRLSITLASLTLLALPFGCGSDTKTTVEVPSPPAVIVEAPTPMPGSLSEPYVEPPGKFDSAVTQTVVEMKHDAHEDAKDAKKDAREAEGEIKKAIEETEDEARRKAKELEAEARKSAGDALDKLLPAPK